MSSPSLPPSADQPSNQTEASTVRNHATIANAYARDVVAGRILACKWVKLACQRQLDDLRASEDEDYPYVFDETKANRICRFIEQLPHLKGFAGNLRLEPWQCFILCSVFGWLRKANGRRRFRLAYILIPRKNGKSLLAAGVGLYMLAADGETGSRVYAGATSESQAMEVCFEPAKEMAEKSPRLCELFGIKVNSKSLVVHKTGSKFVTLIGKPGDGGNPHCALVDEYHEHASDHLVHAMRTGMGARSQPLLWIISTAGSSIGGPCYQQQREIEQILEGSIQRDEVFGIIFGLDEGDDWTSREALIKTNPNFGVSVYEEFLREEQNAAIQSPRLQNAFRTKHLNVWVGADTAWMNMQSWQKQGDRQLRAEEFRGYPCFAAGDLSSKLDIASIFRVFEKEIDGKLHYYAFGRHFLPENRLKEPELEHYRTWAQEGYLETTPGNVIDYNWLAEQTIADVNDDRVLQFGFDPWNAEHFAQMIRAETSAEIVEIPQQVRMLSEPMKQLEALVIDGRLHHDGNPCMNWMMSNVVAHTDAKGNIFPRKEKNELKIDGPVALIMALSRALLSPPLIEAGIL